MHKNEIDLWKLTEEESAALHGEAGNLGPAYVKALEAQEKRQWRENKKQSKRNHA